MAQRGTVDASLLGHTRRLRMPLGALEEVARVTPEIAGLTARLCERPMPTRVSWGEVETVLSAAFKASGVQLTLEQVLDRHGAMACYALAGDLMVAAFEAPPEGEPEAGADSDPTPATTPSA